MRSIWGSIRLTPQPVFHRVTFRRGVVYSARFTPDRQSVVYDAAWEGKPPAIFSTRPDGSESRALYIEPARLMAISRNGELE